MKSQIYRTVKIFFSGEKTKTILWNMTSELIGVYLWFLKFSNVLLKLVQ
jgi:hypothetical protein